MIDHSRSRAITRDLGLVIVAQVCGVAFLVAWEHVAEGNDLASLPVDVAASVPLSVIWTPILLLLAAIYLIALRWLLARLPLGRWNRIASVAAAIVFFTLLGIVVVQGPNTRNARAYIGGLSAFGAVLGATAALPHGRYNGRRDPSQVLGRPEQTRAG
jgi:hypothetical protein